MGHLTTTNGVKVLVDDDLVDYLSQWGWYYYARRGVWGCGAVKRNHDNMLLADIIKCNDPSDGLLVDHIDRNPLDNRRENLRLATKSQNAANRRLFRNNKSGYKGVKCAGGLARPWRCTIMVDGVHHSLGRFATKEEAARRYDEAALFFHGEYACTNAMLGLYP